MSIRMARLLIPAKIKGLLEDYSEDLEQAWTNAGEDPLTISFSAKIGVAKGKNVCEVSISFTKEKIKAAVTFEWNPRQAEMFDIVKGLDDSLKKDGTSMTFEADGYDPVTLGAKDTN